MNKRGQFFILAAVILVSVVITLSIAANYAITKKEPENFYDLTDTIKQEGAQVINYGVYSDNQQISDYTGKIGEYLKDTDPDTEIFFIYGNGSQITIENYAKEDVYTTDGTARACNKALQGTIGITFGGTDVSVDSSASGQDYYTNCSTTISLNSGDSRNLLINISNQTYKFNLDQNKKFIIVTKKRVENETYLDIK